MARYILLFSLLLTLFVGAKPNIIIVLVDDMGFSDIGCYGGEIKTPNLDGMANEGLRFTQFYNTGRCCPTRASLLTGLYPHQAGIGHMVSDKGHPGYIGRLNDSSVTIAEVLRGAGYHTGCFGKWHVSHFDYNTQKANHRDSWPLQRGFDRFVGSLAGGGNFYGPKGWMEDNEFVKPGEGFYYTDVVSDAAVDFIKSSDKEKPLFLYVAYTAPHWPLHAHDKDIAKYKGVYDVGWDAIRDSRYQRMIEMGLIKKEWKLSPRDKRAKAWEDEPDKKWRAHQMATYAAMIDCMDQGVGDIRKALKETGRDEDTLFLFLSDNGGCEENVRLPGINRFATGGQDTSKWGNRKDVMAGPPNTFQSYAIPWANASNTPLRWYKSEVHEGGIATPLVVHWPKGIAKEQHGKWVHDPGHVIDLMTTCVDVADAKYPKTFGKREAIQPMEGRSLVPAFSGKAIERDQPLFFEHERNRAIRDGKWKLVKLNRGDWELYDLEADRSELNNLAAKEVMRVEEMAEKWLAWAERAHVLMDKK